VRLLVPLLRVVGSILLPHAQHFFLIKGCSLGLLTGLVKWGSFSFLYLKKLKFQKYMAVSKIFKTIPLSPPAWATGGLSPTGWATGPKRKKKLHLGPGAQDALNSKLVKSI